MAIASPFPTSYRAGKWKSLASGHRSLIKSNIGDGQEFSLVVLYNFAEYLEPVEAIAQDMRIE
jgi:hypothetical protein